jgi:hypothetical protein
MIRYFPTHYKFLTPLLPTMQRTLNMLSAHMFVGGSHVRFASWTWHCPLIRP